MITRLSVSLALSAILLAGCDSPTGAGLDLAGGGTGEPISFSVPPTTFESAPVKDITGGSSRVLAGTVDDPAVGTTTAIGYMDFQLESSLTTAFTDGPVTEATLTLQKDYLYGDTSAATLFSLTDIEDSWLDTGARSDTVLSTGAEVIQFSVQPSDTTITIPLPQTWIAANDTTLRSVFFNSAFHGFQISTSSTDFVAGFTIGGSSLQIVSGGDTLNFGASQSLTNVSSTPLASPPTDRILLQDGSGVGIDMFIDESSSDSLTLSVLSRATLTVSADTASLAAAPPGFVRPTVRNLELFGSTENGIDVQIRAIEIDDDGKFVFESDLFRDALQQQFIDDPVFESFSIRVPGTLNSISPLTLFAPGVPDKEPSIDVTASLFE